MGQCLRKDMLRLISTVPRKQRRTPLTLETKLRPSNWKKNWVQRNENVMSGSWNTRNCRMGCRHSEKNSSSSARPSAKKFSSCRLTSSCGWWRWPGIVTLYIRNCAWSAKIRQPPQKQVTPRDRKNITMSLIWPDWHRYIPFVSKYSEILSYQRI